MSRVLHGFLQNVLLSSSRSRQLKSASMAFSHQQQSVELRESAGRAAAASSDRGFFPQVVEGIMARAVCGVASLLVMTPVVADTPLSREFTGAGMHAYHAGDYQRSIDDLTAAIEAGSQDPRSYYFRALALLQQGREDEAVADMQEGALLESSGPGSIVIGRSLERIQGRPRLTLEQYRRRALIEQQARDQRRIEQRYTDLIQSEPERLRARRPEAMTPPGTDAAATKPAPAEAAAGAATPPAGAVVPAERTPRQDAGNDDPFAAPGDDPFGANDPFGGNAEPGGAGADPFGTPPASSPEPPASGPPDGADNPFDDPFGDAGADISRPRSRSIG